MTAPAKTDRNDAITVKKIHLDPIPVNNPKVNTLLAKKVNSVETFFLYVLFFEFLGSRFVG